MKRTLPLLLCMALNCGALAQDPARPYVKIDILDVIAAPQKWMKQDIEISGARVYWVEDNDIRIIADHSTTIFVKFAAGPEKFHFKKECSALRNALTDPRCLAVARFSYDQFSVDSPLGTERRFILGGLSAELRQAQ